MTIFVNREKNYLEATEYHEPIKQPTFFNRSSVKVIIIITLAVNALLLLRVFDNVYECSNLKDEEKFDCYPEDGGNQEKCVERGCCWGEPAASRGKPPLDIPWCYYPKGYGGYEFINITPSETGIVAYLERTFPSNYPGDVGLLRINVEYLSNSLLHIKIFDPVNKRYESPYPKLKAPITAKADAPAYSVELTKDKLGFIVKRTSGEIIFDAQDKGGFIFADQFLQLSAAYNGSIYGLGEHQSTFQLDNSWKRFTLFNRDIVPLENMNLYGSHPFYLVMEPNGTSHGVFLLNSNAMDILLQPMPAITFRTIGGIFDFYFVTGPSPAEVVQQYTDLVGRPHMPPYWSLGFHICRYGYKNVSHIEDVLNRTLEAGIPVDTQWVDIDYMTNNNDFTLDNKSFSDLPKFVEKLHNSGMHFVPILDPGVSAGEPNGTYLPYDSGVKLDIFVKNADGSIFIGKVWNKNSTVYPDYTDFKTFFYWNGLIQDLHDRLPFDGLWIDMNEPSNFLDGSIHGCTNNSLDNPPYLPGERDEKLIKKTLCMSSMHKSGPHYNLHNLYGISEAHATYRALREILQARPFIISRSTFAGIGRYSGHWSGDVASSWHDMEMSIPQLLSFSLFGVPMMGSDICGFNGNTTKNLCLRWSQLGAFYPFSRNHNTDDGIPQDPVALGKDVVQAAKNALSIRYTLLPYLYTLFWKAHINGETVARPIFFEFPQDKNTYNLDKSFLWGCCLLVVPVLQDYATTVDTYLPSGRWYSWHTYFGTDSSGVNVSLPAPSDTIPLLIRGGAILPTQEPALNTFKSRSNKMGLIAAYDSNLTADGSLYWDDGSSLQVDKKDEFGVIEFSMTANNLTGNVKKWGTQEVPILGEIKILGFIRLIKKVFFNGTDTQFSHNVTTLVLTIDNLDWPLNTTFIVFWS